MKNIEVSKEFIAKIDDNDFERVSKIKWYKCKGRRSDIYATAFGGKNSISMHRFIMNAEKGQFVDHINGDTLDNRKSNLRIVTRSQNAMNSRLRRFKKHDLPRGVVKNIVKENGNIYIYYVASTWKNGKRIIAGYFKDIETAEKAYIELAKKIHGDYLRE